MTLPFDAYQTCMLLFAGAAALGGYFHVRFECKQNSREIRELWTKYTSAEAKLHELDKAQLGHSKSLEEIVSSLRDAITELRKELTAQREVTLQLERTVARMGAHQT